MIAAALLSGWEVLALCLSVGVTAGAFVWAMWSVNEGRGPVVPTWCGSRVYLRGRAFKWALGWVRHFVARLKGGAR